MEKIFFEGLDGSKSALDLLSEKNIYLSAECGGIGTCGKCKAMINGKWCLACKTYPRGDVIIEFNQRNEEHIKVEDSVWGEVQNNQINLDNVDEKNQVLCIDIGTTTIAAALVDLCTGEILGQASSINHQRLYGSDVISRINASNNGKLKELQHIVKDDLEQIVTDLKVGEQCPIVISANTTMEHLLLGYSCENLGKAPYTPVDICLQKFGRVTILPGISTFVGADIVSGICACQMDNNKEITALIDLGTNGEMAIGNREKILVTSTAAGPAFEGGNISCGIAGISGAICKIKITEGQIDFDTIDNEEPKGICGTGVLEIVFELIKAGIIDETGLMKDEYFDDGFPLNNEISFTQRDVREVQMAKSAIRAGLETLAMEYGTTVTQIEKLYIAGGFGKQIDINKACAIGMIPQELAGKSVAVGNSSLNGAIRFAVQSGFGERLIKVSKTSKEVSLAASKTFNELYLDYMNF